MCVVRYSSKVQIRIDDLLIYVMPNYLLAIMSEKAHPEGRDGRINPSFIHYIQSLKRKRRMRDRQREMCAAE